MKRTEMGHLARALNIQLAEGKAPEWVELLPPGVNVEGRDGRAWVNDQPQAVAEASLAEGAIPVDQEHATEISGGNPAPAAG
ncbi:MAG: phage protease, partial [Pseudomonadota bacterium]